VQTFCWSGAEVVGNTNNLGAPKKTCANLKIVSKWKKVVCKKLKKLRNLFKWYKIF